MLSSCSYCICCGIAHALNPVPRCFFPGWMQSPRIGPKRIGLLVTCILEKLAPGFIQFMRLSWDSPAAMLVPRILKFRCWYSSLQLPSKRGNWQLMRRTPTMRHVGETELNRSCTTTTSVVRLIKTRLRESDETDECMNDPLCVATIFLAYL